MLDEKRIDAISQAKLDALSAKHLHSRRLGKLRPLIQWVDILTIAVPILFFAPRILAIGTSGDKVVQFTGEMLAVVLLVVAVIKLVFNWQGLAEKHYHHLSENITLANEADALLAKSKTASGENAEWFLKMAATLEKPDRDLLVDAKPKEKQEAYREALKEFAPASTKTVCRVCGASPWIFTPGSCQACGNTPTTEK